MLILLLSTCRYKLIYNNKNYYGVEVCVCIAEVEF